MVVKKMMLEGKLMLVTEITSKQELEEMKVIVEIFAIKDRIRELALQS